MRLKTAKVVSDIFDIYAVRNTLTQRMQGPSCIGTTSMDNSHMKNGDVAGLCVFQKPFAYAAVYMHDNQKDIIMVNGMDIIETIPNIKEHTVYFRSESIPLADQAIFFYSLDNVNWHKIGNTLNMKYDLSVFEGNRFSLISFATESLGGYADFDWFRYYSEQIYGNRYSAYREIEEIGRAHV